MVGPAEVRPAGVCGAVGAWCACHALPRRGARAALPRTAASTASLLCATAPQVSHTNPIVIAVIADTVGLHVFVVEVGGEFTKTVGLEAGHNGWTTLIGACSVPVSVLTRFIPVDHAVTNDATHWIKVSQGQQDDAAAAAPGPGGAAAREVCDADEPRAVAPSAVVPTTGSQPPD